MQNWWQTLPLQLLEPEGGWLCRVVKCESKGGGSDRGSSRTWENREPETLSAQYMPRRTEASLYTIDPVLDSSATAQITVAGRGRRSHV